MFVLCKIVCVVKALMLNSKDANEAIIVCSTAMCLQTIRRALLPVLRLPYLATKKAAT